MAGKIGVCIIDPPILHANPQQQLDVDASLHHVMLHRIEGRLRTYFDFNGPVVP
jgi:hypothetical protein